MNYIKILFNGIIISSFLFYLIGEVSGQDFYNLDFEDNCDYSETLLCHWRVSWQSNLRHCEPVIYNKNQSLMIEGEKLKFYRFC